MYQSQSFHPASPLLGRSEPSLPASSYYDPARFERELSQIWGRNWIYVGRSSDLPPMTVRRISVAGQNLILVKDPDGAITCFHNTCRHRGAELCSAPERTLAGRLIVCPYHQWSYSLAGRLVGTPFISETDEFRKADHGLYSVHVREWNGFVFVCLAEDAPDFAKAPDLGPAVYDNWPMEDLVTGHSLTAELACNWKIFWENYNECLHCPGIHPELCDMVPVYKQGIMGHEEAADWTPDTPPPPHGLKAGAKTWTLSGQPCGSEFSQLTDDERNVGHTFVTLLPSMFIVAHVDYVRAVSLKPLGPERTELKAEWLFPRETLDAPGFDLGNVVDFAKTVIRQDGEACEMNQRGLRSSRFKRGVLAPQEFAIFQFHQWVRRQMEEASS